MRHEYRTVARPGLALISIAFSCARRRASSITTFFMDSDGVDDEGNVFSSLDERDV